VAEEILNCEYEVEYAGRKYWLQPPAEILEGKV
jgi:hypothetical protein